MRQPDRRTKVSRVENRLRQRQNYRRATPRTVPQRGRATPTTESDTSKRLMTYDDYVKSLDEQEKLIELEGDDGWDKLAEIAASTWSHLKKIPSVCISALIGVGSFLRPTFVAALHRVNRASPQKARRLYRLVQGSISRIYRRLGRRKSLLLTGGSALLIVALASVLTTTRNVSQSLDPEAGQVESAVDQSQQQRQLDFPIAESETRKDEQGIAFDPDRGVASFRDVIQGYVVTVSQQPLTDEQKLDQDAFLETVAVNLFAQGSFTSEKGPVHYTIPLPDVDPSQTIMFTHKDLLIFVRTQGVELDSIVWERYVNSLQ